MPEMRKVVVVTFAVAFLSASFGVSAAVADRQ
jgi:hypothetical protein